MRQGGKGVKSSDKKSSTGSKNGKGKSKFTNGKKSQGEWKPLHDLKLRMPVANHKAMTLEERKAAQLEKWKKELGLGE